MNQTIKATVCIVAGLLLGSACTSSANEITISTEPVETTAAVETTTTVPPTTTETTLSEAQIEAAATAAAKIEIEATTVAWVTYPLDTSMGEAQLGLEYTTGRLSERLISLAEALTSNGEFLLIGPDQAVEILDIRVDLDAGTAEVDVCRRAAGMRFDLASGDLLGADDGDSFLGEAQFELVDGSWLIEAYFSDEAEGEGECFFSE